MSESLSSSQTPALSAPETAASPVETAPVAAPNIAQNTAQNGVPNVASRFEMTRTQMATLALSGILVAAMAASYGVYESWNRSGQIARGVVVQGEDLSSLTKDQARQKLQKRFGYLSLDVKASEHSYRVPVAALGGHPQISRSVEDAYWFGRAGNLPTNVLRVLEQSEGKTLSLPMKWEKSALRHMMYVVADKYKTPGRDARLRVENGVVEVVPEVPGRAINVGATLKDLQRKYYPGLTHFTVTTKEKTPKLTAADLSGVDTKLGEYRTRFDSDLEGRTTNIRVASATVDGRVLMPNDSFSFNKSTGERTWDKGYRMGHIFETKPGAAKAEVVAGLAGGVCQVSSTLFNAVRKANDANGRGLKILERETHSLPVTYVPSGLDATVAWPDRDFKFRNTYKFPVYLRTQVEGNHLTIGVWARVPANSSTRFAGASDTDKM